MKTWMILSIVAGVLMIGGVFVTAAMDSSPAVKSPEQTTTCSAGGASCPTGGCTATNNCGLASCGATTGGSCGCGR